MSNIKAWSVLNTVAATGGDLSITKGFVKITGLNDPGFAQNDYRRRTTVTATVLPAVLGTTDTATSATVLTVASTGAWTTGAVSRVFKVTVASVDYWFYAATCIINTSFTGFYLGPTGTAPSTASAATVTETGDTAVVYTFSSVAASTTYGASIKYTGSLGEQLVITPTITTPASGQTTTTVAAQWAAAIDGSLNGAGYYVGQAGAVVAVRFPASGGNDAFVYYNTNLSGGVYGAMPTVTVTVPAARQGYGYDLIALGYPSTSNSAENGKVYGPAYYHSVNLVVADKWGNDQKEVQYQIYVLDGTNGDYLAVGVTTGFDLVFP